MELTETPLFSSTCVIFVLLLLLLLVGTLKNAFKNSLMLSVLAVIVKQSNLVVRHGLSFLFHPRSIRISHTAIKMDFFHQTETTELRNIFILQFSTQRIVNHFLSAIWEKNQWLLKCDVAICMTTTTEQLRGLKGLTEVRAGFNYVSYSSEKRKKAHPQTKPNPNQHSP